MKFRLLLFIFSCFSFTLSSQDTSPSERPIITIWIHGTRLTPKIFAYNFFHCEPGLNPVINLDKKYHLRSLTEFLCTKDPEHYCLKNFYTFGWSGKLSSKERKKAAILLYQQLLELIDNYITKYGERPYLRIITHSHGGNVALHLAEIVTDPQFSIDELIFLACPVQKLTSHLITDSCFKKAYSLYTTKDVMQIIDPQGLYAFSQEYNFNTFSTLLSERLFNDAENLKQAQITFNNRSLWHIEFILTKFVGLLPTIIQQMENSTDSSLKIDIKS